MASTEQTLQKRFFCDNCKREVFLQAKYCDNCGGEIEWPKAVEKLRSSLNNSKIVG